MTNYSNISEQVKDISKHRHTHTLLLHTGDRNTKSENPEKLIVRRRMEDRSGMRSGEGEDADKLLVCGRVKDGEGAHAKCIGMSP